MAAMEQGLAEMRADEACATRDQKIHLTPARNEPETGVRCQVHSNDHSDDGARETPEMTREAESLRGCCLVHGCGDVFRVFGVFRGLRLFGETSRPAATGYLTIWLQSIEKGAVGDWLL
jgi:hypothetical protein